MTNFLKKFEKSVITALIISGLMINLPALAQDAQTEVPAQPENLETKQDISIYEKKESLVPSKVYQGEIELNTNADSNLTGEVKTVKEGYKLDLTVSTVISSDTAMSGDQFFAEVTNDVAVEGGIVVPMGSVVHGTVTESQNEKRLGRNGYVKINFDYIVTPDGREIPIEAQLSTKSHPLKSFAKVVLTDAGYTLVGSALGGLLALKLGGIGLAVATHGYSLAGGAALGATVGAAQSLARRGKPLLISPGDQIKIKVNSDLNLPVIKKTALNEDETLLEGLTVEIFDCKFEKDPFGENNTITLGLDVVNTTSRTFTFMDVALVNDSGRSFYPSPFGDTSMWFHKVAPRTKIRGYMSFSVDNPRQKHWIVFYDKYSRSQLARISVRNAIRKLDSANKKTARKKS